MSFNLTSKLPHVGTTIFTRMSDLAQQYQALNLSQGFPDYETDPKLVDLVSKYMKEGYNQYAFMAGVPVLRERIAEKVENLYGIDIHPADEVTVTAGGTQAIFTAIASIIAVGDEVIIFEPAYDCYRPTVELFGGRVIPVMLQAPDFEIDWNEVKHLVSDRTRMIILNNPNNPTGRVLQERDFLALQQLVEMTNILLVSDEVYEHLIFDDRRPHSMLQYESLRSRAFVVASFGKLLHTTGWKVGYCIAPEKLTAEFRKVHQFNVFSVHAPTQYAIADYLSNPEVYLSLPGFFQQKRDLLIEGLSGTGLDILPCEGTYFLNVSYQRISNLPELQFAELLTKEKGVAMIPISAFYATEVNQCLLRICFAKRTDTLSKAVDLLQNIG